MLKPLTEDRISSQRIVVAGTIEVDDVSLARIAKNRTIPKKCILPDRRKFKMAEVSYGVSDFGHYPFSRP